MRFNILCLSGGGFMGLYSVHVLAALEEMSGRPLRDSFDLIAGTSIGGITAVGIANGIPVRDIAEAFEQNGTRIFSARKMPTNPAAMAFDALRFIKGAKYSNRALRMTIEAMVDPELTFGSLKTRMLVPAANLTHGKTHLFRTPHGPGHSANVSLLDACLATSAAPTIFPIHKIGAEYFADGGVFAQAPDHLALTEAEACLGVDPASIHVLSIGTTTSGLDFPEPRSPSMGISEWVEGQRIVKMSWAMQQQVVDHVLRERLGHRYLRLDAMQELEDATHLGLDIATDQAKLRLRRLAEATIDGLRSEPRVSQFLSHQATPFIPVLPLPEDISAAMPPVIDAPSRWRRLSLPEAFLRLKRIIPGPPQAGNPE